MAESRELMFSELVTNRLEAQEDALSLWNPVAEHFESDGPDAAKEYLDGEADRLVQRVQNLLNQFQDR